MAGRQRLAPAGFFGGQFEHAQQARRLREQTAAELDRILAGGGGQFIEEALR